MNSNGPIGLFDSGVGGTSIWREIQQCLPNEHTFYLADSINAPYGIRSKQELIDLCVKNTELLLTHGCKLIVVACNTATTNAISHLRSKYAIPFVGIEPAIKPAALNSKTKSVGILATEGTLNSALFHETANQFGSTVERIEVVGKGLVPLIEQGILNGPEIESLLCQYLDPMIKSGVDHIVLGCSHYPLLIPVIKRLIPSHVTIIDSGFAAARQTKAVLIQNRLLNESSEPGGGVGEKTKTPPQYEFWTNSNPEPLKELIHAQISMLDQKSTDRQTTTIEDKILVIRKDF